MSTEEFKIFKKTIPLEEKSDLMSIYKIKSYEQKLKQIESQKIPQKPINEVLNHLIVKNNLLSRKSKESIIKILYSKNDRLIVLITSSGNEVIWKRDKLIKEYGWYFYTVNEKAEQKSKKPRPNHELPKGEEVTLSTEPFLFEGIEIPIKQKTNMRALYGTKEYKQHLNLIKSKKIPQMPIKDVINDLLLKNELIPLKEKKAIRKIIYYQSEKVIVIKSLMGDHMYENLEKLVTKYGWYFYITGVPVGDSEISIVVDKIEKRFTADYFKNISLKSSDKPNEKIQVALYPIVVKPNHNCIILRIGKFNLMLDCGILEHHFDHIKRYLENFDQILEESEKQRQAENKLSETTTVEIKRPEERLNELKELVNFEAETQDIENRSGNVETIDSEQKENEKGSFETNATTLVPPPLSNNLPPKYKIDAIFISHSHFDHVTGLMELIKRYPNIPILTSRLTMDLFLLRDSNFLKQEKHDTIEQEEYLNVVRNVIFVENGSKIEFKDNDCFLSFFHAGHMPGALMILAKTNDFRFLFTGDYTYWDVTPFAGTRRFLEQISRPIDFLLIDGTSAYEDFGDPQQQIENLILFMEQKADYGDNSLIGADPSSLAITFMLTLWRFFRKLQLREDFKKRPNIYVDMMVRKNIQVINHRYEYIYGPISKLIRDKANPFNSIKFRWFDHNDLDFLRTKNNIIISHPPDLSYGIIRPIINTIGRNRHNLVFLSGAINEQPGLDLISGAEEIVFSDTWKFPFRALLLNTFMPQLKIKLHGDKSQLMEMVKSLQPKEVCFYHQSPRKLVDVANEVKLMGVKKVSIPRKRMLVLLN